MRTRDPPRDVTLSDIAAELEKLNRHAANLAAEIAKLGGRIQPFAPEDNRPKDEPYIPRTERKITPAALWRSMVGMDQIIGQCELDLAAIRAQIESIAGNAVSREEFKRYLAPKPR